MSVKLCEKDALKSYDVFVRKICEKVTGTEFKPTWDKFSEIIKDEKISNEDAEKYVEALKSIEQILKQIKPTTTNNGKVDESNINKPTLMEDDDDDLLILVPSPPAKKISNINTVRRRKKKVLRTSNKEAKEVKPKIPVFRIKYKDVFKSKKQAKTGSNLTVENVENLNGNINEKSNLLSFTSSTPVCKQEKIVEVRENIFSPIVPEEKLKETEIKLEDFSTNEMIETVENGEIIRKKAVKRVIAQMCYLTTDNKIYFMCKLCEVRIDCIEKLFYHLCDCHFMNRWLGNCTTCIRQSPAGNIFNELIHMIDEHILKLNTIAFDNLKIFHDNTTIYEEFMAKIMIQASLAEKKTTPMISIPSENDMIKRRKHIQQIAVCPWISEDKIKRLKVGVDVKVLSRACLTSTFKCMNRTCWYFTSSKKSFERHLKIHESEVKFETHFCSYCKFSTKSGSELTAHLSEVHENDQNQCSLCFYRCSEFHFYEHIATYHKHKAKARIYSTQKNISNLKKSPVKPEIEDGHFCKKSLRLVPSMTCMIHTCKKKFYNFENYLEHVKGHDYIPRTKCIKCQNWINRSEIMHHLKNCHGFGIYQCCYCRYGTDYKSMLAKHYANLHSSFVPFFYQRNNKANNSEMDGKNSKENLKLERIQFSKPSNLKTAIQIIHSLLPNTD